MTCSNCSFPANHGLAFCANCGFALPKSPVANDTRNLAVIILKALSIPLIGYLLAATAWIFMPYVSVTRDSYKTITLVLNYSVVVGLVIFLIGHSIDFKFYLSRKGAGAWAWALELTAVLLLIGSSILIAVKMQYHFGDFVYVAKNVAVGTFITESVAILLFGVAQLVGGLRSRKY